MENKGGDCFWNILFIYLFYCFKKHFCFLYILSEKAYNSTQFQKHWTLHLGLLVSIVVAITVQCIMKKEKNNNNKRPRFFTEGHIGMIGILLGCIRLTSMCSSSINWSSCHIPWLAGFQENYLSRVVEPEFTVSLSFPLIFSLPFSRVHHSHTAAGNDTLK